MSSGVLLSAEAGADDASISWAYDATGEDAIPSTEKRPLQARVVNRVREPSSTR